MAVFIFLPCSAILFRILMLLVRLRNMKLFAPLVLAAPLETSNHLKGE
jgi:hypothetical protein